MNMIICQIKPNTGNRMPEYKSGQQNRLHQVAGPNARLIPVAYAMSPKIAQ